MSSTFMKRNFKGAINLKVNMPYWFYLPVDLAS